MASPAVIPPSDGLEYEDSSDAEEGVDQLYSESEDENNTASKKSTAQQVREIGQTILPQQRLENIIQNDGVTGNLALSKEALFVVSLATEEFIKRLVEGGRRQANRDMRFFINYRDMSMAAQRYEEFMFLQETIPTPITLRKAILLREAKEIEMIEEDPAMVGAPYLARSAPSAAPSIAPSVAPSEDSASGVSLNSKVRKSPHTNGRSNGSSSIRHEKSEHRSRPTPLRECISASVSRTGSADVQRAPTTNMDQQPDGEDRPSSVPRNDSTRVSGDESAYASRSPTSTPAPLKDEVVKQPSPPYEPRGFNHLQGPGQPPPLAGPASAFLQDPNGLVVRGGQIPGRTIYSQQRPTQ